MLLLQTNTLQTYSLKERRCGGGAMVVFLQLEKLTLKMVTEQLTLKMVTEQVAWQVA